MGVKEYRLRAPNYRSDVIDLDRYISANDFLIDLESRQEVAGSQEAAFNWVKDQGFGRDDMNYVLEGYGRLRGDFKAEGWKPGRPELDAVVWAFHRAWIDRYGQAATNETGLERWRSS